jgi:hypothetical protein
MQQQRQQQATPSPAAFASWGGAPPQPPPAAAAARGPSLRSTPGASFDDDVVNRLATAALLEAPQPFAGHANGAAQGFAARRGRPVGAAGLGHHPAVTPQSHAAPVHGMGQTPRGLAAAAQAGMGMAVGPGGATVHPSVASTMLVVAAATQGQSFAGQSRGVAPNGGMRRTDARPPSAGPMPGMPQRRLVPAGQAGMHMTGGGAALPFANPHPHPGMHMMPQGQGLAGQAGAATPGGGMRVPAAHRWHAGNMPGVAQGQGVAGHGLNQLCPPSPAHTAAAREFLQPSMQHPAAGGAGHGMGVAHPTGLARHPAAPVNQVPVGSPDFIPQGQGFFQPQLQNTPYACQGFASLGLASPFFPECFTGRGDGQGRQGQATQRHATLEAVMRGEVEDIDLDDDEARNSPGWFGWASGGFSQG